MIRQKYLSKRFDEAAVVATLGKLAFQTEPSLENIDHAVISALRRSSPEWNLTVPEMGERLEGYSADQLAGLVSNVKGILHEMEFVQLENGDGDSVIASLFPDVNHKSVDIQMMDRETGEIWAIQLKASDDTSYINSWLDSNSDTEIFVTEELSEKMDLPSSGLSNEDLTVRVEDFVDRLLDLSESADDSIWNSMPTLAVISSGIVVFELWRRYRINEISLDEFKRLTFITIGQKAGKYTMLFSALSVPGLNVIAGAYMLGSFILAFNKSFTKAPNIKLGHSGIPIRS